jgi:HAD superfamily hydrolase (TIGR01509 family)
MIKLIIFDLDGVLVSTKDLHYISLNKALSNIDSNYEILLKDHIERYDGLPTSRKLKMLTIDKNLPVNLYEQINTDKQKYTFDLIRKTIKKDERLINILKHLKEDGFKIYVASNAIRETVKLLLYYTGLIEYVDHYISNEDVKHAKPNSEIYLKCIIDAGVNPDETLIVEDSPRGIESAQNTKAHLLIVENPDSVTYEKIIKQTMENKEIGNVKLKLSNFNILIPMAGEGSRFQKAGYTFPKPLIEVNEKPMIQVVVDNLGFDANFIYVVRKEHYEKYNLKSFLNLITPNCKIVQVDSLTEGACSTTLLAKEYINNENPLIIANSDQFLEWNPTAFYYKMIETKADGGIVTFRSTHPKWSFAKLNESGNVTQVAEKDPISDNATCGVYYYKKGSDYVKYAEQMIEKNIRVNNEFYVCPVFNEFILDDKKIKTYDIQRMWGIGVPEDLEYYLKNYNK